MGELILHDWRCLPSQRATLTRTVLGHMDLSLDGKWHGDGDALGPAAPIVLRRRRCPSDHCDRDSISKRAWLCFGLGGQPSLDDSDGFRFAETCP